MYQKRDVANTQQESNSEIPKLPVIAPQKSMCRPPKDCFNDEREMANGFEATRTVETLPADIGPADKQRVKAVTFDCDKQDDIKLEKSVLRLPNIQESFGCTSSEKRQTRESYRKNKNSVFNEGPEKERSTDNGVSGDENLPRLTKNYEYHREKRYTNCSQKLSRAKYTYFPRFPFPKPLSKRERLKKEIEERTSKKRADVIHPGTLRSEDEYSQIFLSLRKVEKQFVRKHKLPCRTSLGSPFFP